MGYIHVIKYSRVFFGFVSAWLCQSLWTYLDTTLAIKLADDFQLGPDTIALIYSAQMAGFLPLSFFVHKIIHYFGPSKHHLLTGTVAFGFLLQATGTYMIGPSYILRSFLPNIIPLIVTGLVLTGLGGAFTAIISYEEMSLGYYTK